VPDAQTAIPYDSRDKAAGSCFTICPSNENATIFELGSQVLNDVGINTLCDYAYDACAPSDVKATTQGPGCSACDYGQASS
jgi:hypothetical protein